MKVEIDNHVKTFRFPSEDLIYFSQSYKISKLYNENVMIYCTFGDTIYDPKSIQLIKNYGSFNNCLLEVHVSVVVLYVLLISQLFDDKKLLIMDGQTGEFTKYTKNIELKKENTIVKKEKIKFCFLDLFSY